MTKTVLTIDTQAREIRTKDGVTVEFLRIDGEWVGELQNYHEVPPDGMEAERFLWETARLWNEQIYRAVGFLTLAGTTLYGSTWIKPMALEMGLRASEIQHWVDREVPIIMSDDIWADVLKIILKHCDAASEEVERAKITQTFEWIEAALNDAKKSPENVDDVVSKIVPFERKSLSKTNLTLG